MKDIRIYAFKIICKLKILIITSIRTWSLFRNRQDQVAFLIGSPEHGNLGDHAISIAELSFLKDNYPNLQIKEITGHLFRANSKRILKRIQPKDIVFITGGGFIGSLWIEEEQMVRDIISNLPDNPIFIFPQTIYFEDTNYGRIQKAISKACYESHKNLCICLRDQYSYDFMKKEFQGVAKIIFIPDIVTYLNFTEPVLERNDVLLCLRKDKEMILSNNEMTKIEELLNERNLKYVYTSTVLEDKIKLNKREEILMNKINEFKKYQLVITDRLHGMVFAAITGTPCVAFNSLSRKVEGTYNWLKNIANLQYITYARSCEDLKEMIDRNLTQKSKFYYNTNFHAYYDELSHEIRNKIATVVQTPSSQVIKSVP